MSANITELDYALNCAAVEIDTTNARAELAQLRATVTAQAAIIKEQEQDIANIAAREAVVVENHRKANAALEAAVNEARELLTTLEWNDWNDSVDAWLTAHPAVTPQEEQE